MSEATCYECNVVGAVRAFKSVCDDFGLDCREIDSMLDGNPTVEDWLKTLREIRDRHDGQPREAFDYILSELCDVLSGSKYECKL